MLHKIVAAARGAQKVVVVGDINAYVHKSGSKNTIVMGYTVLEAIDPLVLVLAKIGDKSTFSKRIGANR